MNLLFVWHYLYYMYLVLLKVSAAAAAATGHGAGCARDLGGGLLPSLPRPRRCCGPAPACRRLSLGLPAAPAASPLLPWLAPSSSRGANGSHCCQRDAIKCEPSQPLFYFRVCL